MSCIMAFAITFVRSGFEAGFMQAWLRAWGVSFAVGVPTAIIAFPVLRAIVDAFTRRY